MLALNPAARHYLRQRLGQVPSHIGEVFDLRRPARRRRPGAVPAARAARPASCTCVLSAPRAKARRLERGSRRRCARPAHRRSLRLAGAGQGPQPAGADPGRDRCRQGGFARQLHQASARRDKPFVAL
ncbi:hypothetical protein ACPA9J_09650 [Pseudomonas aeruginosa]